MLAETICRIKKTGLMGIVRVETIERGIEIAQGCIDGGVDVLEISYTNNNAGEVIRALKEKFGDQLLVGAGTVLDPTTARLAIMDGAEFIIAPTFNKEVQEMANLYQIPYAPGCTSYTEMIEALKAGASFIKAFPISNYYGYIIIGFVLGSYLQMPVLGAALVGLAFALIQYKQIGKDDGLIMQTETVNAEGIFDEDE